jgi:ATP-dependent protease HslVU (ClpYQ) peptidase subunit
MTCIVGLQTKSGVWIGGDSAGTNGRMDQSIRKDKKVFVRGEFIMGFCGSFRMGDLLKHSLVLPEKQVGNDDVAFMVNDFVNAVKNCFGPENEGKTAKEHITPAFLVGYRGKLFSVQPDYQVGQPETGYDAMGAGAGIALGAMHMSKGMRNHESRIRQALEASQSNNASVRAPFNILFLKK